jgi:3-deoxy-D-arabino-heptulosonate 7-phosphate (DAHP) synthase class II
MVTNVRDWSPTSWQKKTAQQQVAYSDTAALQRVLAEMAALPPLVVGDRELARRSRKSCARRGVRAARRRLRRELR